MRETNPKCEVITEIQADRVEPSAQIVFSECQYSVLEMQLYVY